MKELNNAYAILRDCFGRSIVSNPPMFPKALTFGRASYRKKNSTDRGTHSPKSEGENVDHKDDKTATTLKCPHCGRGKFKSRLSGWAFHLRLICRQCRKKFKPVVLSNVKSKKPQSLEAANLRLNQINCDNCGKILFLDGL